MVAFPNAKINLGLDILARRDDGYHDIESVLYPIPFCDVLEIRESNSLRFNSTGLSIPGDPSSNLCLKAYHLFKRDYAIPPIEIHLHKIIPMGGGLGGGSSDAAQLIHMLNDLFETGLSLPEMAVMASVLGSDCPFFIYNSPRLATGRGTELEDVKIDLSGYKLLIVFPPVHSSTLSAYSKVIPSPSKVPVADIIQRPLYEWKDLLKNDFESSVFEQFPVLSEIKNYLYTHGAIYSSMTGSGSVIFGIFESEIELGISHEFQWLSL